MLSGARKDSQLVTSEWEIIHGGSRRRVREVCMCRAIMASSPKLSFGMGPDGPAGRALYQSRLFPGAIGAWSCHTHQSIGCSSTKATETGALRRT